MSLLPSGVSHHEFRGAIKRLGWSQARFARELGVSTRSVESWVCGDRPIPRYAVLFLRRVQDPLKNPNVTVVQQVAP